MSEQSVVETVCVCGHRKGTHAGVGPCLVNFSEGYCHCQMFRANLDAAGHTHGAGTVEHPEAVADTWGGPKWTPELAEELEGKPEDHDCSMCGRPYTLEQLGGATVPCPTCNGRSGDPYSHEPFGCNTCGGTGKVEAFPQPVTDCNQLPEGQPLPNPHQLPDRPGLVVAIGPKRDVAGYMNRAEAYMDAQDAEIAKLRTIAKHWYEECKRAEAEVEKMRALVLSACKAGLLETERAERHVDAFATARAEGRVEGLREAAPTAKESK